MPLPDHSSLRSRPGEQIGGKPCFADARYPFDEDALAVSTPRLLIALDADAKFVAPPTSGTSMLAVALKVTPSVHWCSRRGTGTWVRTCSARATVCGVGSRCNSAERISQHAR